MKRLILILIVLFSLSTLFGCSKNQDKVDNKADEVNQTNGDEDTEDAGITENFKGEELSILVSVGWMDKRFDKTIKRFEDTYEVTVDLQVVPADQYDDLLQSKLTTDSVADVFWIHSNPFAIESVIVDPEKHCIDFTGSSWENLMPEARKDACVYNGKLYGLQLWHNSPSYIMLYNKTLFEELGIENTPTTYNEFLEICEIIATSGITPWFLPGADGWQHQLPFFQIGGVYEQDSPGLYEALNNNTATFAGNKKMLEVLEQFKEISDKGYFGEDWIGTDSTNRDNIIADRDAAMTVVNTSYLKQLRNETDTTDEFGFFLIPLGDNQTFPTTSAAPAMFGNKNSEHPELVKTFFDFVTTTESLQEILDNAPRDTNLDVNDDNVVQHWMPEEEEFMNSIDPSLMSTQILQAGTKYTNDQWQLFGQDLVAYCLGQIEANDVLENMDFNRSESAKVAKDPAWQ